MRCPICKSELKFVEFVTVSDVLGGNVWEKKYVCSTCTSTFGVWWDSTGELYSDKYIKDYGTMFVDGNTGAFGSWARKSRVEIYKHDEEFELFEFWGWKGEIRYRYTSNDEGDILSRKPYLQLFRKDGDGWTYYTSGIKMLLYCCKQIWKNRKDVKFIAEYAKGSEWDKRWWKVVAVRFSKLFV